jgi:inosose dehydratase
MGGSPWAATSRDTLMKDVARTAQFVKAMGGRWVVFSGAFPKARPLPADTWPKMAEFVNEVGRVCAANGVACLYHNHWVECEGDGMEQLCRLTDPKLVGFAFDTGHALRAGKDPAAVIGALGKRLGLIHLGDYSDQDTSAVKRPPLGEGRLNIKAVAAALQNAGFDQWIVLEEETRAANGRALAEKGMSIFRAAFPRAR